MLKSALPYEIFGRTLILRRCTRSHFGVDTLKRGPTAPANIPDALVAILRRIYAFYSKRAVAVSNILASRALP